MIEHLSTSEEETKNIAMDFAKRIHYPCVIGLSGNLGSGKTTFTKGVGEFFEVKELLTSPTFLGISEYYSGKVPFIHMDFYMKVIQKTEIEYYKSKNGILLIEWIDNYKLIFNENLNLDYLVKIEYIDDFKRKIVISNREDIQI